MKWSNGTGSWSVSLWALLLAVLLFWSTLTVQGQSSTPNSPKLDPITQQAQPLWDVLLQATQSLPSQMDSFMTSLQSQTDSLQASNEQLQASNRSLTQQGADLQASLQASQAQAAISESKRLQLQKDLEDSTVSITQAGNDLKKAQSDAHALELQLGLFKVGFWIAVPVAADLAVKAFSGKDVIEWIVSAFRK